MATVYLAQDLRHDRRVALKVLKPELAAVLGAERFVVEIKTTAALQHPHILPLFDSGTAEGFLYYVMPYVEGETLRARLDRETQLGIDEAVRLTREVADALDYAHRRGVIHRDVKPENILLHDGRPMVADFGIALAVSAAAGGRMTETGLSLGTPHYMSPEQATADKEISARSDIYSLGSVLYEMLAGRPPHLGGSAQQVIMQVVTEEAVPVSRLRKSVPPNVSAAVSKALEKLPADRFDTAARFGAALADPHFTVVTTAAPGARASRPRSRLTLGLAVALAAMTLFAGLALLRPRPSAPVIRYALALPPEQAPVANGFLLVTRDGSRIIYVGPSSRSGTDQLWVKARDRLAASPISGTEAVTAAALSPDDVSIAFVQRGVLRTIPLAGGAPVTLAENAATLGSVAWLEDGTIVYLARGGTQVRSLPERGGADSLRWVSDSLLLTELRGLPEGRGVLFRGCPPPCDRGDIWGLDFRSDSARIVVPDATAALYLPEVRRLLYVREDRAALSAPFDLATLTLGGPPLAAFDSIAGDYDRAVITASVSGTVVMRTGTLPEAGMFELVWVDRAGRQTAVDPGWQFRVTQNAGNYGWALSPDGKRLAIGLNTPEGDDIWIKPLPDGPASRVTYNPGTEMRPRWMPGGQAITYVLGHGIHRRRADGTGADSLLLLHPQLDEGVVSSDGSWLVFRRGATSSNAGGRDIFGLRLGVDTAPVPLVASPYDEMAVALSPDGKVLAYQSDETGRTEVYIRPFPNTNAARVQVSSVGGTGVLWARDGRELFYRRSDEIMIAVPVIYGPPLRLGEPQELFRIPEHLGVLPSQYYTPWDVGPDRRFIMVRAVGGGRGSDSPVIVVENWFEELKAKLSR